MYKKRFKRLLLIVTIFMFLSIGVFTGCTKVDDNKKNSVGELDNKAYEFVDLADEAYADLEDHKDESNVEIVEPEVIEEVPTAVQEATFESIVFYVPSYMERYMAYEKIFTELSKEEIVLNVNMNLDYPFYDEAAFVEADSGDGVLILCNKYSKLPELYTPDHLTLVPEMYYIPDGKTYQLNQTALDQFIKMSTAANEDQIDIKIVSAYRTHSYQDGLYNRYKNNYGQEDADTYSARAGHSEHETGLAIDINQVSNSFKDTEAYKWLQSNAHEYGFILRYPPDMALKTGYIYEPWHYRYVGIDTAKIIVKEQLLFDEYYAKYILHHKINN